MNYLLPTVTACSRPTPPPPTLFPPLIPSRCLLSSTGNNSSLSVTLLIHVYANSSFISLPGIFSFNVLSLFLDVNTFTRGTRNHRVTAITAISRGLTMCFSHEYTRSPNNPISMTRTLIFRTRNPRHLRLSSSGDHTTRKGRRPTLGPQQCGSRVPGS